jgi:hypothetical protein
MKGRPIAIAVLIGCFTLSILTPSTRAVSDWVGVYASIDKVVFEPNDSAPERIQIWGAFALAVNENRNDYQPAKRGYLYYALKPGKEEVCRKEWADLKRIAGSESIIGFGVRNEPVRLRKSDEKPANPDFYPVGMGLVKIYDRGTEYAPIRDLKSLPRAPK